MNKNLPDWLIVCVWRALLGEIYPSIRAVAIALSDNRILTIRYYLDRIPLDMDHESIEVVATNISASISLDMIAHIEVDCQYSSSSFGALDCLDGFIYCRREYDL
ncbi:colicin [Paraherbaspirillum soli]|uniref:colicin n=1 Tax=Paraherbaspirillum soli TaxID=631222 RepID=UPI003670EE55